MGHSVTVTSTNGDGGKVTIQIDATGADTGMITAVTSGNGAGRAGKTDIVKLTRVRRIRKADAITCRAKAAGLDLEVRCTLNASHEQQPPSVSIVAKALILKLLDETYPLDPGEYEDIRTFLADANFPTG